MANQISLDLSLMSLKFSSFNTYVIRTPIIPFSWVNKLTQNKIFELCRIPFISEAIYIASPELHSEMLKLIDGKTVKNEKKLLQTLLKYLLRMGFRCTPFGLFSGCATGKFDDDTHIDMKDSKSHKRETRLDMNFLCALAQKIEENADIRNSLHYYPNTSLSQIGNDLRYVEYRYEKALRRHFTVSIENSEYIRIILNTAKNGASIDTLSSLINEPDVSAEDASNFIHELIDNQILVSSISPSVTGEDYLNLLIDKISDNGIKSYLKEINNVLNQVNNSPIGYGLNYYNTLIEIIEKFNVGFEKKFLFQTDLFPKFKSNKIDSKIIDKVNKALSVLNKLTPYVVNEELEKFKNEFYDRYEDEEIPLSLALDVEAGIGYGKNGEGSFDISPLIDDIFFDGQNNISNNHRKINWSFRDTLLNKKIRDSVKTGSLAINLTDQDLIDFKENWDDLPDTFSVLVNLIKAKKNGSDELIYIDHVGGASATVLLGRFCQSSKEIRNLVTKIIESEELIREDIYAEIAHLPEKRTGNILNRPNLRRYEIPYLANSTLELENQIDISDIMISVVNERVILRSKKLNRYIAPKLASAHNYSSASLPIYHFLCDLQLQNNRESIGFNWGNLYSLYDFFPRVSYKDIILSPATWLVNKGKIKNLVSLKAVASWRKKEEIPSKILLVDGDNQLLIDLEHELSIELFISCIKGKNEVIISECLYDFENSVVNFNGEPCTNEVILSYHRNQESLMES